MLYTDQFAFHRRCEIHPQIAGVTCIEGTAHEGTIRRAFAQQRQVMLRALKGR